MYEKYCDAIVTTTIYKLAYINIEWGLLPRSRTVSVARLYQWRIGTMMDWDTSSERELIMEMEPNIDEHVCMHVIVNLCLNAVYAVC